MSRLKVDPRVITLPLNFFGLVFEWTDIHSNYLTLHTVCKSWSVMLVRKFAFEAIKIIPHISFMESMATNDLIPLIHEMSEGITVELLQRYIIAANHWNYTMDKSPSLTQQLSLKHMMCIIKNLKIHFLKERVLHCTSSEIYIFIQKTTLELIKFYRHMIACGHVVNIVNRCANLTYGDINSLTLLKENHQCYKRAPKFSENLEKEVYTPAYIEMFLKFDEIKREICYSGNTDEPVDPDQHLARISEWNYSEVNLYELI
jgi:hypothetical protein